MKKRKWLGLFTAVVSFAFLKTGFAETRYVSPSGGHVLPFTNWVAAATNIQAAIDAASDGDTVLVTNGVYATGGRVVYGAMTNRVAITKAVTLCSVNGPVATIIQGAGPMGDSAVRCAYVGGNAVLNGFTLTKGATRSSGDLDREMSGGGVWCESSGVLSNCILTGNSAFSAGGGVAGGGTLNHCTLIGNSACYFGGGASEGALYNCTLTGNSAGSLGGGVYVGTLNNCALIGNSAHNYGGGAYYSTLYHCTLTGNSAMETGGGASGGALFNCIVYYNDAVLGANYDNSTFNYSCTTPYPGGSDNITNEPKLASASHLAMGSPCRGAGNSLYAMGTDLDGEAWRNPPSMGCDEMACGSITDALSVSAWASYTNVSVGFPIRFRADNGGRTMGSMWNFGDGVILSNVPYASHAYASNGVHSVFLRAYNETYPEGIVATVTLHVAARVIHYVDVSNATPAAPYTSWTTAATNIQDALDAATQVGALVLVSNGVYATGGRVVFGAMTNRVAITKPVTVCSVHGPAATVIQGVGPMGDSAVRCAYVGANAVLEGFTLTNGATRSSGDLDQEESGGGAWCELFGVLSNCVLSGNSAYGFGGGSVYGALYNCTLSGNLASSYSGGGACYGTLYNCALTGNSASSGGGASGSALYNCALTGNSASSGGGASDSAFYNCALTGNSASSGGGANYSTLYNCIVYYNEAARCANYDNSTFNYSCTTPYPGGSGNITNEPKLASASHLAMGSPCRGKGNAAYASGMDIDGETWFSPPSMGCDEIHAGAATGLLRAAIAVAYTNVGVGFTVAFTALIEGRATASRWDFGDGTVISNRPYAAHAWSGAGVYPVVLTAWNESVPQGVSATARVAVAVHIHYVSAHSLAPAFPFVTWETAASTIQEAVDAVSVPGALVLVSNGVYRTGGRPANGALTNRVVIDKPLVMRSVNGPEATIIEGAWPRGDAATRCVYLGTNATLIGFTLTNGHTQTYYNGKDIIGGGIFCESSAVLSNCVLSGNSARSGGGAYDGALYNCTLAGNLASYYGGGAYGGALYNCTLTGNRAYDEGGGSSGGALHNCTLTGNYAEHGGGTSGSALYNCMLTGNSAERGGGTSGGALYNCTLTGNSAYSAGGGVSYGTFYNCIVYYNTAKYGTNYSGGTFNYCCTTPDPGGTNNITDEPQFVSEAAGDYRLLPSSPCVDRGINQDWMVDATDLAGNPRILNGTVDMGAYEFYFEGNFKVWLQGPYDTNTHELTTALNDAGYLPLTSPYADDPRRVSAIPSNASDWALFQLRRSANSAPFVSKSVFLSQEGTLLADDGAANLMVEASTGTYYLVVKHRNHLAAMSAEPAAFTNQRVSYDFTPSADRYYGGTNGVVQLESNVWGMIAADADGDGEILGVDALLYDTQTNSTGYKRADFNLDGVVSNDDRDVFWSNNSGRRTTIAQGETILKPALKLQPARRTLPAESEYAFSAAGGTGTITWAFVKDPSGGAIPAAYSTSILYRAGTTSSCIDVLEAWDSENRLGRTYINVISSNEMARAGKAMIVAGRKSAADSLWPTTDYLADLAFNTLLYRGYSKDNIHYLNPVTNQDVDGNGRVDDIDEETTWAQAASTFTNWAIRADRLFVYLVDHGGDSSGAGYFRLNESETLTATQLDAWLDELQNTYTTKVTVLIDCCYAGSFLDELAYTGAAPRIVIAACGTNEPTYFVAGGLVSFSDAFFSGVMRGDDIKQTCVAAGNAMAGYQNACWLDPGNFAVGLRLGASFVAGKDIPQIGSVAGNQGLTKTTAAVLWAGDVVSVYPIERVWCLVVPPGHRPNSEDPVADLSELDLIYDNNSGRYQARYEGFKEEGPYKIFYYAEDVWGSVSPPRQSYVTQSGYDERVILAAGGSTDLANRPLIDGLAQYAYRAFQTRWLNDESIYSLSVATNRDMNGDGLNDVDALISLANLANAITNWAGSTNWGGPADALTVCLIGEGANQTLRLNESQALSAESLNDWLNAFLESNEKAKVNVIMDFSGSGRFLSGLAASNRVCIASCLPDQPAIWAAEGVVSFSRYFLSGLFEGDTLYQAYSRAERTMRRATSPICQRAQLDDTGDGVASKEDGPLAKQRYIGAAFMTGADTPTIGSVTPDTVLTNTTALWLWAAGVTDRDGISNVWCVITPPNYDGGTDLESVDLPWNDTKARYEALYTNFTLGGAYILTFQAIDSNGVVSLPLQAEVVLPDAYEPDNTNVEANAFVLNETQIHNFHSSADEDWVKFYAIPNFSYDIEIVQLGTNVDTALDVYYENPDGTLTKIDHQDGSGVGLDEIEATGLDEPTAGMYYVRVSSGNSNAWGASSEYELKVMISVGSELVVFTEDRLNPGLSPPGARAIVDGIRTQLFVNRTNCISFSFPPNSSSIHTVKVETAAGYRMEEDSKNPNQITNAFLPYFGNPQIVSNGFAGFLFYPYVRVASNSVVRDRWTQERLSGVNIAFKVPPGGALSTVVYDGYPNFASYKSHWYSQPDGAFPTNVWLRAINYELTLTKADYSNGVFTNVIVNPTPGQTTDLGTLWLFPVDTNGNGLADRWEERYFGGRTNGAPTEDPDGDGHNNRQEYQVGTDPTNGDSALKLHIAAQTANGMTLTWPVVRDRFYNIRTCDRLSSEPWTQCVFGPLEARVGQTQMQWIITNPADQPNQFYRVTAPAR